MFVRASGGRRSVEDGAGDGSLADREFAQRSRVDLLSIDHSDQKCEVAFARFHKWNARANGSKSIRSEPNHSRAIVITNVLCCCCCSLDYLLAINLHITATLRILESLNFQTIHGTSSHILHSFKPDVDTNYLEPKVSKPNGLVRSGDRYRDGDIESAREWFVSLLSCLCLSLPSHVVD